MLSVCRRLSTLCASRINKLFLMHKVFLSQNFKRLLCKNITSHDIISYTEAYKMSNDTQKMHQYKQDFRLLKFRSFFQKYENSGRTKSQSIWQKDYISFQFRVVGVNEQTSKKKKTTGCHDAPFPWHCTLDCIGLHTYFSVLFIGLLSIFLVLSKVFTYNIFMLIYLCIFFLYESLSWQLH